MRSGLFNISTILLWLLVSLAHSQVIAQDSSDLGIFQHKYPGSSLVYDLEKQDVTIEMKKGRPRITMKDYSSRFILKDNATTLSDFKFYFNKTYQVKEMHAYSLIPDGNKYRKMPVSEYVTTAETDDGVFFDDNYAWSFNFYSVGKGTKLVVESETALSDPFLPVTFSFGHYTPVDRSRLTLTLPKNVKIRYRLFGGPDTAIIRFNSVRQGKKITYTWAADDLNAYGRDSQAPDWRYYVPHIIIQISGYDLDGTFIPVNGILDDLYRYYYKNLRNTELVVNGRIKKLADSLTMGITRPEDKVSAIYQWVQTQIRYVAIEDGENGVVPCNPELVLQRMYGDCKGKTSILVYLLRSLGLKVSYAWVGSRSLPYRFSEFPARIASNHMVAVWWNEKDEPVILDGTSLHRPMYDIPAGIQGKECLIEKGEHDYKVYRIPVAPPGANLCTDSVTIRIETGTLYGYAKATFTGERKANMLYAFGRVDTSRFREIVSSELPKASNKFIVGTVSTSNLHETGTEFNVNYSFTIPDYLTSGSDRIYLNMNLDRFPGSLTVDDDRTMPVEAEQTFDNLFSCILKVPEGYSLEKIPDGTSFSDPEFGFIQQYSLKNDTLTLSTRVYFAFQIITGEKVKQFSQMLSALQRAYSKSIVLLKN